MIPKTWPLIVIVFSLLVGVASGSAYASNITVTIEDNAGTVHTLGPSTSPVDLTPASPPTYSGFTIGDIGAGARVTDNGVNDASDDVLHLRGVVITATAANVTGRITFWATDFTTGPSGYLTYETTAKGTLTRIVGGLTRAAKDSWIKISGYLDQSFNPQWDEIGIQQSHYVTSETPTSYGTINKTTAQTYTLSASNRGMKGYIEFYLKNSGDMLKLPDGATDGVRVRYAGPGGPGCPPGLTCNEDPTQCPVGPMPPNCPEGSQCMPCVKDSERSWWGRFSCWLFGSCPCCIINDRGPRLPVDQLEKKAE